MPILDQLPIFDSDTPSLVTEVAENLGLSAPSASTDPAAQKIVTNLNHTQKVLTRRHDWRSLERLDSSAIITKDQWQYNLPPQIARIIDARLIDDTSYVLADCNSDWSYPGSATGTCDSKYRRWGDHAIKMVISGDDNGAVTAHSEERAGTLSSVADGSSGRSIFTAGAAHDLAKGDVVTIVGTSAYNGTYTVLATPASTTFTIKKTYAAETLSGATWAHVDAAYDLSGIQDGMVGYWIYSDTAIAAADLIVSLSESASGASGIINLSCPAIDANTWTYVKHTGVDCTALNAFRTVGILTDFDSTTPTIYMDSINLYAQDYGGLTWPLKIINRTTLDTIVPSPGYIESWKPTVLAQGADSLEFFRKPDGNYPIWLRYKIWPEAFSSAVARNAQVSQIRDVDDVLIAGATWLGFVKERSWTSAGHWEGTFRRLLSEAIHQDNKADGYLPQMEGFGGHAKLNFGDTLEVPQEAALTERGDTSGFFLLI